MKKTKIKFAGINSNGNECYVTEAGNYVASIDNNFYFLNQNHEYGFVGIEGEPDYKVDKTKLEIVENF